MEQVFADLEVNFTWLVYDNYLQARFIQLMVELIYPTSYRNQKRAKDENQDSNFVALHKPVLIQCAGINSCN
jgi:hypothetical protein